MILRYAYDHVLFYSARQLEIKTLLGTMHKYVFILVHPAFRSTESPEMALSTLASQVLLVDGNGCPLDVDGGRNSDVFD
jgi:hypothetical protein